MNPIFDVYGKLFTLLVRPLQVFPEELAEQIVSLATGNEGISLEGADSLDELRRWHNSAVEQEEDELDIKEIIAKHCFADLSSQMHNEAVQELHENWREWCGLGDDLFIHIRRSKDLGNGTATVTAVVSDVVRYRLYLEDPDKVTYAGETHVSYSDEAKDPS